LWSIKDAAKLREKSHIRRLGTGFTGLRGKFCATKGSFDKACQNIICWFFGLSHQFIIRGGYPPRMIKL
jgi:hypothetical protein